MLLFIATPLTLVDSMYFRSNVAGTHFTLFDNGCNPKRNLTAGDVVRQELVSIIYVSGSP